MLMKILIKNIMICYKLLFSSKEFGKIENMKNKCNENIGFFYYNKGIHLHRNANSEFQNTIEMYKIANLLIKIEMI